MHLSTCAAATSVFVVSNPQLPQCHGASLVVWGLSLLSLRWNPMAGCVLSFWLGVQEKSVMWMIDFGLRTRKLSCISRMISRLRAAGVGSPGG